MKTIHVRVYLPVGLCLMWLHALSLQGQEPPPAADAPRQSEVARQEADRAYNEKREAHEKAKAEAVAAEKSLAEAERNEHDAAVGLAESIGEATKARAEAGAMIDAKDDVVGLVKDYHAMVQKFGEHSEAPYKTLDAQDKLAEASDSESQAQQERAQAERELVKASAQDVIDRGKAAKASSAKQNAKGGTKAKSKDGNSRDRSDKGAGGYRDRDGNHHDAGAVDRASDRMNGNPTA